MIALRIDTKTAAWWVLAIVLAAVAIGTPLGSNLWLLATGRGFFVPPQSSVFSFTVTKMNEGSGEWWLYARDHDRLYALHPSEPMYVSAALKAQDGCAGFRAQDFTTWCSLQEHPITQAEPR